MDLTFLHFFSMLSSCSSGRTRKYNLLQPFHSNFLNFVVEPRQSRVDNTSNYMKYYSFECKFLLAEFITWETNNIIANVMIKKVHLSFAFSLIYKIEMNTRLLFLSFSSWIMKKKKKELNYYAINDNFHCSLQFLRNICIFLMLNLTPKKPCKHLEQYQSFQM